MIRATLTSLERFLLPNACVACSALVERSSPDALVCGVCRTRLEVVRGGCPRCHQPLPPVGPCRFCAVWPVHLLEVRSAVWLGPEARAMVHYLKYGGLTRLATRMAESIRRVVPHPGNAWLVPVPLGRRRLQRRGYNQAAMLASALGRLWGLDVVEGLLQRERETRSQTGLSPQERASNLAGAFTAARRAGAQDWSGLVMLVDDVLTTGATVVAAGTALAESGWEQVGGLTFTRAAPFDKHVLSSRARGRAPTDQNSFTPFSRAV